MNAFRYLTGGRERKKIKQEERIIKRKKNKKFDNAKIVYKKEM
jgi:hypothetical protein